MFQIIMPRSDICYDISLSFFNHCCGKTPEETTYGKKGIAQSVRASAITGWGSTRVQGSRSPGQEAGRASSEPETNVSSAPAATSSSLCHLLKTLQPSKWCHKLGAERSKHEPMGGRSDPNHMSLLLFLDVLFVGFRTEN